MPMLRAARQATHIFDGLEQWPTHIMFLTRGKLKLFKRAEEIPELAEDRLLELVERCVLTSPACLCSASRQRDKSAWTHITDCAAPQVAA